MLNIDNIFQLKICLLAYKISENEANIPEAGFKHQTHNLSQSDIHSLNTRYAPNLNFHVLSVRSNYCKRTF